MAIRIGGQEPTDITFNGSQANYATLNGTIVWQRVAAVPFTVADTGASFSVSTTTVSWTPPTTGTLVGSPTYSNGHTFSPVTTDTTRYQSFQVTVPNDPQWTNAGQTLTFQLSDVQEATVYYPPIISGFVATQSTTNPDHVDLSWSVDMQGYSQVGDTRIYFNGGNTTTSAGNTTFTATGLQQGTNESFTVEIDSSQGTGSATTSVFLLTEYLFTDGYVAGSFAINSNGVPSATLQNSATGLSFFPTSYDLSCTSIPRAGDVSFTVPSGYWNTGDTLTNNESTTQPGYGNPAIAASMAEVSGSLTNISSSGASGTHSITVTNPTDVGEWNVVYSGTGITPSSRSGCGNRAGVSWTVAQNTGPARSGTITLYAGSTQTTVLATLSWNQAAGVVNATSLNAFPNSTIFEADTGYQTETITINGVTPSNGQWNVTKDSGGASSLSISGSGTGNGSATVTYSGFGSGTATFRVRAGALSTGTILATITAEASDVL